MRDLIILCCISCVGQILLNHSERLCCSLCSSLIFIPSISLSTCTLLPPHLTVLLSLFKSLVFTLTPLVLPFLLPSPLLPPAVCAWLCMHLQQTHPQCWGVAFPSFIYRQYSGAVDQLYIVQLLYKQLLTNTATLMTVDWKKQNRMWIGSWSTAS